ncbi:SusC/RagA family TonB-linked outer membrane protein [Chryseobacterium kwangjuense]|nr:SusC/RagA family TonB-linked outer membrane protein [Chryseobacterium kwangjuense]
MKILCSAAVFLLIGWQGLQAQQNLSQMRVSFEIGKTPASKAVEKFLTENNIQYNYSTDDLKNYTVQPFKCQNEPVMNCLKKMLKDIPVETLIYNNSIIIRPKKNKVISAHVDEHTPAIIKADTMREASNIHTIDEVVLNAGYYKVTGKNRTGSIAKVSSKEIENQPVTNVLSSLQGRMSGVNITQNSGIPGGGFTIQIRGQNSLRTSMNSSIDGNLPLYVVDGVPLSEITAENTQIAATVMPSGKINPLNSINPNDIESIEVLKDADATAIYGSRGANGVILITTKKGKSGKLNVRFTTNYGISEAISNLILLNKHQYLDMRRKAYANDGVINYPAIAYDLNGTWENNEIDWKKKLIGNKATFSNTQLSASGGSDTTNFLVSLGHNEQTPPFGQGYKYVSNTFNSNLSHHSKDNHFQISFSNMFTNQKNNVVRTDITSSSYTLAPVAPQLYNEDGSLNWAGNTFTNPIAAFNASYSNDTKLFQSNINADYRIYTDLKFKVNAGLNYTSINELSLLPNTVNNPSLASGASSATSQSRKKDQDIFSFIIEPQLNWTKSFGNHKVDFLIGGSFQRNVRATDEITGIGFESNQFITNVSAAKTIRMGDQSSIEYRYAALFGRINYQYKNRYILNITGRRDGSSRFGQNNRFANFGALGIAWLFSNEEFLKDSGWLSFGKLRSSYGSTGSDNIGDFQFLDNYNVSSTLIYNGVTGLLPARLFNPNYSWEKTRKFEAAIELGFLNNRINANLAYYRNRSSNQLVGYQLSAVTGFPSVTANLNATVQNTGLELELNAKPISNKNFSWETSFNITVPKNKLLSFPGLDGSPYASQYSIGSSTQIVKLYQLEGINPQTGQYQFTDFNGDGKISTPEDRQVIEDLQINFFGGLNNSIRYKNLDFSLLFQFVKKKNYNQNSIMPLPGTMVNQPVEVLDVWSADNPNGLYMPYSASKNLLSHNLFKGSTAAVSDASFIRLKNIELGYNLPINSSPFKSVKIYFQGQNLITWTKFFGVDPEALISGFLPPLRTYSFGLQLNF